MDVIRAALIACRFVHDTAAMTLWGTFGYLLICVPEDLAEETTKRLGRLPAIAAVATIITAVTLLPIKTAMIADGWPSAFSPKILWAVVWTTSIGTAWLVDIAASILLVLAIFLRPPHRILAITVSSALVLSSLVLTGHAMMREHWLGYLQQANDFVHVLAGGAWLGALVPFMLIMRGLSETNACDDHYIALRRFSLAGQVAVVLILATGAANTLLIVGDWPINWSSPYQVLLCAKVAVVLVMIGLASRNHFLLVPRLGHDRRAVAIAIRQAAFVEAVLGVIAIALVAVFGLLDPGQVS